MNRRSIADGLQSPSPRQLSPAERAFKETGTIPENIENSKARHFESMKSRQLESTADTTHVAPSPSPELQQESFSPRSGQEATKQITVRIPVSMWRALIQAVTNNKAQGSPLCSQQDLIQHLIKRWLEEQKRVTPEGT
jgi:hypothetical protein